MSLRQLAAPRPSAGIRTREPGSSWLVHRTHCRCTLGSLWPRTSRPWPGIRPCSVSSRLNMSLPLRGPGSDRDLATTAPLASVARTASFVHAFFLSDQSRRACPCCGGGRSGCRCRRAVSCHAPASCPRSSSHCLRRAPPTPPGAPRRRPRPPPAEGTRPGSHLHVAAGGQNAGECPCVQVDPAHVRLVDPVVDGVFFRDLPCRPVSRRRGPVARRQAGAPPRLRPVARLALVQGARRADHLTPEDPAHKTKLFGVAPVRSRSCRRRR